MKLKPANLFKRTSLTFKLSLGITILIMLLMAATGFATYMRDRNILTEETYSRSWSTVETIQTLALTPLQNDNYRTLNDLTAQLAQDDFINNIAITDSTGNVVAHNNKSVIGEKLSNFGKIENKDRYINQVRDSEGNPSTLMVAAPIKENNGDKEGYVYLASDLSRLQGHLQETIRSILFYFVLASIAGLLLTRLIILRSVYRPVKALVQANEKIATGDFSQKVQINTRDELGYLSKSFNTMTEQLGVLFQSLRDTVFDISNISNNIIKHSEDLKNAGESNGKNYEDIAKELNSSARRLTRITNKLNSLAQQYKTESPNPDK